MNSDSPTVLVVDDDPGVREAVTIALELEHYRVRAAADGIEALAVLGEWDPDVIVLDVLMPGLDGLAVCRQLRALGDRTPVLMLTARDSIGDRVAGLDAGADDYLVKPFDLDELFARLRALLRRAVPLPAASTGNLVLRSEAQLAIRAGRSIQLTHTESALLDVLISNDGQVVSRETLMDRVWGRDFGPASNSLDVYIGYLRRKLEADGEDRILHTVRGLGYRLDAG